MTFEESRNADLNRRLKPLPTKEYGSPWGWILPDGKFYACQESMEHVWLADQLGQTEVAAEKRGWIKLTRVGGETFIIGFRNPTDAQIRTLLDWGDHKTLRMNYVTEWLKGRIF